MLRRLCNRAGITKTGWHTTRHSFASWLVMRGRPLKAVQELLGHRSIRTTMIYAHLGEGVLADAVAVLDDPPATRDAELTEHAEAV